MTSGGGSGSQPVQYVKFEALSEINGKPYASMAEFNVLDTAGVPIPRSGWSVSADSQELQGENGAATNAIDGNTESIWHTQWYAAKPPMPHQLVVNLGAARAVGGFKYLPRPSSSGVNGTVVGWRLYTSNDGVNWVQIASGNFAADSTEKTVYPVR